MREYGPADGGRMNGRNSGSERWGAHESRPVKPAPKRQNQGPVLHKPEHTEPMRINKFLSDAGVCSRREADRLIEMGKVTVDGIPAEMGTRVLPGQRVSVNGKPIRIEEEDILLVVNKPIGIVCTTAEFDKDNIVDYINYPKRVYPIGRLDKDSSGLILMTNQGELVNKILRGGNHHEKEYMVRVNRPVTPEFVMAMEAGVVLDDGVRTLPCRVEKTGGYSFKIILTQGLNRQIRRMCEALDYRVTNLKRVRVMNIELGDLRVGSYRRVTPEEYRELRRLLEDSTDLSWADASRQGLVRGPEVLPVPERRPLPEKRPAVERKPLPEKRTIVERKPGSETKPLPERKLTPEKRPITGRPIPGKTPISERNPAPNRPAPGKRREPVYEIPPQPKPRIEKKSVIKRGEIKPTSGKNIVIRRPEK